MEFFNGDLMEAPSMIWHQRLAPQLKALGWRTRRLGPLSAISA
jgi:hypothetical protein